MPESSAQSAPGTWADSHCPFAIEYVPRVLDDIRLAVVDAFFSLPRGGAEIGGLLLGTHDADRVRIAEYVPLDCEHATGPSFVLSVRDEGELEKLLQHAKSDFPDLQPVGWYHSHTRSEIFLSDADLTIHNRFFPEPWQVALVLKPHTFHPMRCGFFFREASGSIHADSSYQEFTLEAMPLRTIPTGDIPPVCGDGPVAQRHDLKTPGTVIELPPSVMVEPQTEIENTPKDAAQNIPSETPSFTPPAFALAPERKPWPWMKIAMGLLIGVGVSTAGFQIGKNWLPRVMGSAAGSQRPPVVMAAAKALAFNILDADGQLQIRWDRSAPSVQEATAAMLTIRDDALAPRIIRLDEVHLRSGSFTYSREGEHVDVSLSIERSGVTIEKAATTFLGKPVKGPAADGEVARLKQEVAAQLAERRRIEKQLADQSLLIAQATKMSERIQKLEKSVGEAQAQAADVPKLRKDLAAANGRNQQLAKDLADAQAEIRQQQRRRMGNQDPGKQ